MHDIVIQGSEHLTDKPLWMWGLFIGIVLFLLVLDLGLFNRKDHEIGVKESLLMSLFYFVIAVLFGAWVWYELGAQSGHEYMTGYLVEKTLALDNVFVISLVFSFFAIPRLYQHRVLFWGILGVIILRGIMIALGAQLVQFGWVLYLFAIFLIATGIKMLFAVDEEPDIANNFFLKLMRKYFRTTDELHGNKFLVRLPDPKNPSRRRVYMTPLLVALILVEIVDVVFAVDSVPAIFTITTDPYIVYTSNIFAILGLRALYFALAAIIHRFHYLKYALALVLVFIGSKIFIADLLNLTKFPAGISLGVTVALIASGIIYSMYKTKSNGNAARSH